MIVVADNGVVFVVFAAAVVVDGVDVVDIADWEPVFVDFDIDFGFGSFSDVVNAENVVDMIDAGFRIFLEKNISGFGSPYLDFALGFEFDFDFDFDFGKDWIGAGRNL